MKFFLDLGFYGPACVEERVGYVRLTLRGKGIVILAAEAEELGNALVKAAEAARGVR